MDLGIINFPAFLLVTAITIVLPGPNSLFVLAIAARQGHRDAYRAALGVMVGDGLLMLASVLGVSALLQRYPSLFMVLRCLGAAYLAWVGVNLLRAAYQRWQHGAGPAASMQARELRPFQKTLAICLTNPKAILFFMAFFIQFVDVHTPRPWLAFLLLGLVLQIISLSWLSVLIFAGVKLAQQFSQRPTWAAVATGGAGLVLLGFASRLLASVLAV